MSEKNEPLIWQAQIRDVKFGKNVKVIGPVNLYECGIGDDCLIGTFVEIQMNVKIGDRTRVQSHSFICEYVSIGNDCFVGHGVKFVNDSFSVGKPAYGDKSKWRKITVGDNVCIGTNATIMASICDNAVIGAGAVVTKNITEVGIYAGVTAKFLRVVDEYNKKEFPDVTGISTTIFP